MQADAMYGLERFRHRLLKQRWFTTYLLPALPRTIRWGLRTIYFLPCDLLDHWRGRGAEMIPPRSLNFTGAVSDLNTSAAEYVAKLTDRAGLTPSMKVLDVGSGFGRLAVGLIPYLDDRGSYDGLEIIKAAVKWCNRAIAAAHPNIRFHHADLFNKEYNPRGKCTAATYKFPFADRTFDRVVLTSVFTHMLPDEIDNYLGEIVRVLKPGGCCYITYMMLTDESRPRTATPDSIMQFKFDRGSHALISEKVPELSVGYDDRFVRQLYARHGLEYRFLPGNWCGQPSPWPREGIAEQDVVIGRKSA